MTRYDTIRYDTQLHHKRSSGSMRYCMHDCRHQRPMQHVQRGLSALKRCTSAATDSHCVTWNSQCDLVAMWWPCCVWTMLTNSGQSAHKSLHAIGLAMQATTTLTIHYHPFLLHHNLETASCDKKLAHIRR
jgi:hypothetical protein